MKYIILLIAILFSACSTKNYEQTQTKIITIKSPKIKYSDAGYLRNSGKSLELELFMAGKSIEKISVNHLICTSEGCKSKSGFNQEYLSSAYPEDTMQNMLLAHPIYERPNSWVVNYLRSQLEVYVQKGSDLSLVLDISDAKAKERLNRALNKRNILHYQINYTYDNRFVSKLYSDFAHYSFGNLCKENEERERNYFYTVLECPIGASQDVLRQNYKKLAKAYHPDKIVHEAPYMVKHYTQKFQLLQEVYTALRVS